ncbi:MAG: hypothetical protein WD063_02085 [Pirellulales bacterium]
MTPAVASEVDQQVFLFGGGKVLCFVESAQPFHAGFLRRRGRSRSEQRDHYESKYHSRSHRISPGACQRGARACATLPIWPILAVLGAKTRIIPLALLG